MARSRAPRTSTKPSTATRRTPRAETSVASATAILAWEDDPGTPPVLRSPIGRPEPNLAHGSLPVSITTPAPALAQYQPGTAEFRYYTCADALSRVSEFWNGLLGGTTWEPSNGPVLPVVLDEGVQLNAFYNRNGLHFFHGSTQGVTVYSGESPDVVCHEFGHAVLDAVKPHLFDAMSAEVAAFHESFGDMSSILTSMRLREFATRVLVETRGKVNCTSRMSRMAEQLGWAIRQCKPDATAPDCLREAANSFFYQAPEVLPPQTPSAQLSSEPHSMSRVFTASFLDILGGMFVLQPQQDEAALATVANDAGKLLIEGVKASPVVPTFMSQVAIHMIQVDQQLNQGKYFKPLANGFVRHGVLAPSSAAAPPAHAEMRSNGAASTEDPLSAIAISGTRFGLPQELFVYAASQPKRYAVSGAANEVGQVDPVDHDRAANSFLEDLVRRGRVGFDDREASVFDAEDMRQTHRVKRERKRLVLRRRLFDCGFAP
jgi:hypothetical protein